MGRAKIAITLDEDVLAEIDRLVERGLFANRSEAIEDALRSGITRLRRLLLARECAKLDRHEEQAFADKG